LKFLIGMLTWIILICNAGSLLAEIEYTDDDGEITFRNEHIQIVFDEYMYAKVSYLEGQRTLSINENSDLGELGRPPFFIRLNNRTYTHFRVESSSCSEYFTDPVYGPGRKLTIISQDEFIEQTLTLEMYYQYPDVVLMQATYGNEGASPLAIDDIYCQYYRLDRSLTNRTLARYDFRHTKPVQDAWGRSYLNLPVTRDYSEEFLVPLGGYGRSGVPFIDVWGAEMGMAIFLVESTPRIIRIPCQVKSDERVDIALHLRPSESLGQFPEKLAPHREVTTWKTAVCVHQLDYFTPARRFAQLLDGALRKAGKEGFIKEYPARAYAPYWKTWGMNSKKGSGEFTLSQISARMDELADAGFKAIMLDDGWFDTVGLWNPDPGKFPHGSQDMITFVNDCHQQQWGEDNDAFRVYLWWDPLGSETAQDPVKDLLIRDREGNYYTGGQAGYMLCPAHDGTLRYLNETILNRFYNHWDVDGVYHDWVDQNAPPCYAPNHNHVTARESVESGHDPFQAMHERIMQWKPESHWDSQCNCAAVHDVYQYPYYYFEDTSDPTSDSQIRYRLKWIKALRGPTAPVGDGYLDDMDYNKLSGEPAQSVAIGAVITSLRWKVEELGGREHAQKWMDLYVSEQLSSGEFLNLYDVYYDRPEGYAIRKEDGTLYYCFIQSDSSYSGPARLRGLHPERTYAVTDYETNRSYGEVSGQSPAISVRLRPGHNEDGKIFYTVLKCTPLAQ